MTIRVMTIADYPAVYALWDSLPGIGLHEHEDSLEGMNYYLSRNPGSCFIAEEENAFWDALGATRREDALYRSIGTEQSL